MNHCYFARRTHFARDVSLTPHFSEVLHTKPGGKPFKRFLPVAEPTCTARKRRR